MKKIELHWLILGALVLGVLYGVLFAPYFKFTKKSKEKLETYIISDSLFNELKTLENEVFTSERLVDNAINDVLTQYYLRKVVKDDMLVYKKNKWYYADDYEQRLKTEKIPAELRSRMKVLFESGFNSKQKAEESLSAIVKEFAAPIKNRIKSHALVTVFAGYKSWTFTDISYVQIRKQSLPRSTYNKLDEIVGQEFSSDQQFLKKIKSLLGHEQTARFGQHVVQSAHVVDRIKYVSWMGDLFMRGLKMIIVPIILTSIISGVANIGKAENLGRLGAKTILYYIATSLFAIVTGLTVVNLLKPGVGTKLEFTASVDELDLSQQTIGETLLKIVPTNIFDAFVNNDTLSIIFFAILFGFFITKVNRKSSIFLTDFFNASFDVIMKITMFIIKFTPLGIFGIVAVVVSQQANDMEKLTELFARLGLYMLVILLGLFVHAAITLPIFLRFIGKVNPIAHFKVMRSALLTAFSTCSSGATLSLTIDSVERGDGVSNKVSSFVLPLGATINMDGTALYECVAAMFIAQAYGVELSFMQQFIVVMTALLASIGAASIPMAGLVMLTIVVAAVGLPLEGIGLILAVDRILDMFRTATNVWSDSCGTVIIARSEGEELNV